MATLKFGFKRTIPSNPLKNIKSKFGDQDNETHEVKDFVHSIEGTEINGRSKKAEVEKELVIPMIHKNQWRKGKKGKDAVLNGSSSRPKSKEDRKLEDQAVTEILESARNANENGVGGPELDAIPLLFQNRIPDGFETDDKLDVSLRAEESCLEDYERIPIEQFGLAMLRGMGWNKSEGIGLKNKRVVDTKDPQVRPRGLGLGAERPNV